MIWAWAVTVLVFGPPLLLWLGARLADLAGEAEWSAVDQSWDAELHRRYLARFPRLR